MLKEGNITKGQGRCLEISTEGRGPMRLQVFLGETAEGEGKKNFSKG